MRKRQCSQLFLYFSFLNQGFSSPHLTTTIPDAFQSQGKTNRWTKLEEAGSLYLAGMMKTSWCQGSLTWQLYRADTSVCSFVNALQHSPIIEGSPHVTGCTTPPTCHFFFSPLTTVFWPNFLLKGPLTPRGSHKTRHKINLLHLCHIYPLA